MLDLRWASGQAKPPGCLLACPLGRPWRDHWHVHWPVRAHDKLRGVRQSGERKESTQVGR